MKIECSATASGINRAKESITAIIDSVSFNEISDFINKEIELKITTGTIAISLDEVGEINDILSDKIGYSSRIIMEVAEDLSIGKSILVHINL